MENLTGYVYCQRNQFKWNKPLTWLSTAIRFFAKVQYNHVGIIVQNKTDIWLYEAVEKGVVRTDFREKIKNKKYKEDFLILKPYYREFSKPVCIAEGNYLLKKPYDFENLFIVQLLWDTLNIWVGAKTEVKALKRLICYEVVWFVHRRSNTFKNEWWKSKPSYIYNSREFKKLEAFDI